MTIGPLMIDLEGTDISPAENEMLQHPLVGGVILFTRNYSDPIQVKNLCQKIRELKTTPLLIAVDQEGGRVQRFQQGFTKLPACRCFGELYDLDIEQAKQMAEQTGWLMATELLAVGVDFSFAPVLDIDKGVSEVIGDRAFHQTSVETAILANAYMQGMHRAGMAAVGKHFPGHGSVAADSHHEIPLDQRTYVDIQDDDLQSFKSLITAGIEAIMPAHVIYPNVDQEPAGFSKFWLQEILRKQLSFDGVIFSDDISMAGAEVAGDYPARAVKALTSGCDMVLVCNQPQQAELILQQLEYSQTDESHQRLTTMIGHPKIQLEELPKKTEYQITQQKLNKLIHQL